MSFMFLPILLLRDDLVLVGAHVRLPRVARGRRGFLRGTDREAGRQAIEVLAAARRARDRRVLGARDRLELVSARAAMKVVNRHGMLPHSGSVASTRRGSRRHTLPASRFDSHTDPSPTRTASPPLPANCCATVLVAGSMRESGNSNAVTQTDPSPTAISPPGPGTPTSIVATTLFVFGSMRDTLPSPWFNVHTAPAPVAMKRGD